MEVRSRLLLIAISLQSRVWPIGYGVKKQSAAVLGSAKVEVDYCDARLQAHPPTKRRWWNWYTRYFEGVVVARSCEFESHPAHIRENCFQRQFSLFLIYSLPEMPSLYRSPRAFRIPRSSRSPRISISPSSPTYQKCKPHLAKRINTTIKRYFVLHSSDFCSTFAA